MDAIWSWCLLWFCRCCSLAYALCSLSRAFCSSKPSSNSCRNFYTHRFFYIQTQQTISSSEMMLNLIFGMIIAHLYGSWDHWMVEENKTWQNVLFFFRGLNSALTNKTKHTAWEYVASTCRSFGSGKVHKVPSFTLVCFWCTAYN